MPSVGAGAAASGGGGGGHRGPQHQHPRSQLHRCVGRFTLLCHQLGNITVLSPIISLCLPLLCFPLLTQALVEDQLALLTLPVSGNSSELKPVIIWRVGGEAGGR